MDIRSLKIFCEVYRAKSFTLAARRLSLTQSAVSQQIKALEGELGIMLFDVDSRNMPTAAGEALYDEAIMIISRMDDIPDLLQKTAGMASGHIKFGMIDVVATALLPKVLTRFKTKNPGIGLEAVVKASRELVEMINDFTLEFAVLVLNGLEDRFHTMSIYNDSIVAMLPPQWPGNDKAIKIKDLKGVPLILYPPTSRTRSIIDDAFAMKGIHPAVGMEMHYPAAISALVRQGMGVGLISGLSATEVGEKGQKIAPIEELSGVRKIGVVCNPRRRPKPQTRFLIETISQMISKKSAQHFFKTCDKKNER